MVRPDRAEAVVGQVEQAGELVGGGGVAAQVVVELAGAVVVAGAGDDQAEVGGDAPQPVADLGGVVLVVDLEAGQARVAQRGEAGLVERAVVVSRRPRVGDDADSPGVGDDADHRGQVGGVAVDVRRTAGAEVARERLVAVGHHAEGDQRVGDVRTAQRGGVGRAAADVVGVDLDAEPAQPLEDGRQPAVAAGQHPVELVDQRRVGGVGQVGEQVHAAAGEAGADLDPADEGDPGPLGDVGRLVPALGGVVVGQGEDVDALGVRVPDQLRGGVGAVGAVRVGMEVDPHRPTLRAAEDSLVRAVARRPPAVLTRRGESRRRGGR